MRAVSASQGREGSKYGGHFRVEQTGDIVHVVPTAVRNRNGAWVAQKSILDTPISLKEKNVTAYEMVRAIAYAVTAASNVRVELGTNDLDSGLMDENGPSKYSLASDEESARSVLMRALADIDAERGGRRTWLLFYGNQATANWYALNILTIEDSRRIKKIVLGVPAETKSPLKIQSAASVPVP